MKKKQNNNSEKITLEAMQKLLDQQTIELREEIQLSESRTDKKMEQLRDDVLASNDKVVGELESIREEQVLSVGQYRDHEERISALEK